MDPIMLQTLFDDDDDDEMEHLMSLCLPKHVLKTNDDYLYNEIHSAYINLASTVDKNDDDSINMFNSSWTPKIIPNLSDNITNSIDNPKTERKRKRLKIGYTTSNKEAASEFIDSDIDDEQIQKFLRSRKKTRLFRKLAKPSLDPRNKIIENRLSNPFEGKTDEQFFDHLRVTKATYKLLLGKVKDASVFRDNLLGGNYPIQAEQALQMFLFYMGHRCTYKVLSDMYHISESAIMSSFLKCVSGINRLDDQEVHWPSSPQELRAIRAGFEKISGLPGMIGSIGGCCVEMRTNKEPPAGYKIGKLRSIMYLLAVTDASLRFIYLQAGFPGTFCLQEAFESSSLGEMIKTNSSSLFSEQNSFLVGNGDLVLDKHLMVPYSTSTGALTETQAEFNAKLAKSNVCRKAFSRLKCRFTSLKTQVYANLEKIPNIIKACCIIHNLALKDPHDMGYLKKDLVDVSEDYSAFRDESDFVPSTPDGEAFEKRDKIAMQISLQ